MFGVKNTLKLDDPKNTSLWKPREVLKKRNHFAK